MNIESTFARAYLESSLMGLRSPRMRNAAEQAMQLRRQAHLLQEQAAQSNLENEISYAQTADGWAQSIDNILGRMGELAVAANDGTKSAIDRQSLQYEFSQMQQAIQSIATGPNALAKFNGMPIFQDGNIIAQA
ncbi:MAG TPA: hypothetical protein DCZ95_11980 [Verrucomicrobia bacterium]|nr:MAG: hypothetical protein A2X46_14030 [Lentisphaerae bacterium GWF2_57_35]HBA84803.1 hypothetical protein [Verrucomicrobiota bacterium]